MHGHKADKQDDKAPGCPEEYHIFSKRLIFYQNVAKKYTDKFTGKIRNKAICTVNSDITQPSGAVHEDANNLICSNKKHIRNKYTGQL